MGNGTSSGRVVGPWSELLYLGGNGIRIQELSISSRPCKPIDHHHGPNLERPSSEHGTMVLKVKGFFYIFPHKAGGSCDLISGCGTV